MDETSPRAAPLPRGGHRRGRNIRPQVVAHVAGATELALERVLALPAERLHSLQTLDLLLPLFAVRAPPPPSRTDWTRLVPPPVLTDKRDQPPRQPPRQPTQQRVL